jgi:hypothetical protein
VYLKKAAEMGLTPAEIVELATLAMAFGGAPVMMFRHEVQRSLRRRRAAVSSASRWAWPGLNHYRGR